MILVVGATGLLGNHICRLLREEGRRVRALVRKGSPGEARLRELGVEIVSGDLRIPSDVDAACHGVEAVISTATAMGTKDRSLKLRAVDRDGQLSLVDAARRHGVGHFTFVSVSPNFGDRSPLIRYKREVESAIRASGMHWTILQPTVFMEIWLGPALGWNPSTSQASIFGGGNVPLQWVSAVDVARYAVASLHEPRLRDRDVPLGGPDALSPNAVLEMFERISGRRYAVKRVPLAMLRAMAPIVGLFDEMNASGMRLGIDSAGGDPIDSPLQRELGIPLTSVDQYVRSVAS